MNNKIRKLRTLVGLTETQLSNLLNMSSYKYIRCEIGTIDFPTESVVLLSIIFQVPIDYLLYNKYSIEDVIKSSNVSDLKLKSKQDILRDFQDNICRTCSCSFSKISYKVIRQVIIDKQKNFSENLAIICNEQNLNELDLIANLKISDELYKNIKSAKYLPDINLLIKFSEYLGVSLKNLFDL